MRNTLGCALQNIANNMMWPNLDITIRWLEGCRQSFDRTPITTPKHVYFMRYMPYDFDAGDIAIGIEGSLGMLYFSLRTGRWATGQGTYVDQYILRMAKRHSLYLVSINALPTLIGHDSSVAMAMMYCKLAHKVVWHDGALRLTTTSLGKSLISYI